MKESITRRDFDRAAADALMAQGVFPLAARVLAARGISERADIAPKLSSLPLPDAFAAAGNVAKHLAHSIANNKRICVIGDYDADGMTSTALAVQAMTKMGADVIWRIPSRGDGYGLSEALVRQAADDGAKTLLTVDNGVNAEDAVRAAKNAGMTMLITDHHLGGECPDADAIAHPRSFAPLDGLAGVGVIFYVMAALKKAMNADIDMGDYLDLVALGTIADCAPLNLVNRAFVHAGMMRMRKHRARKGLLHLVELAKCNMAMLNSRDISFRLAPRINAAGRMDKVKSAMENLLAESDADAKTTAARLCELNSARGDLQRGILKEARKTLPRQMPPGIVAAGQKWHEGIIGIIAGILCDEHRRPVVVFGGDNNGNWKGSGRAPPHWDLHKILQTAAAKHPALIADFGGHSRAIGIKITAEKIPQFAEVFAQVCGEQTPPDAEPKVQVDALPPPADITPEAVAELHDIAWGEAFAAPLFAGEYKVLSEKPMGAGGGHRKLLLEAGGKRFSAVQFNQSVSGASDIFALFRLDCGRYGEVRMLIEKAL
ncbi:MAG: single-stranded-DNA-specific exonuclease RecJ [Gammaproteobacteria bacterium]